MRRRTMNRVVQLLMAVALVVTGWPLVQPWLPQGPLPVRPLAADDEGPVPGKIVVDARDSLTPSQLASLNQAYGVSLVDSGETGAKVLVADVPPGQEQALLARLRKDRLVEAADLMHRFRAYYTPNDPRFKEQWNMKMIGAEKAWDRTRGKGVTVAVIDTGVAFENDEKCYRARDFGGTPFTGGYDVVNNDNHPYDDQGHGTHVAGTIAETTNNSEGVAGLAFEATIMPIKVLDANGSGTSASIAKGVRWAADHGAQVINMSLGGPFPDRVMHNACKYAAKKGVLIVCAAGNSGRGPVGYPGGFPECMAVSAVGPSGELTPYSSIGKEVAIAAPGGDTERGAKPEGGVLQNTVLHDGVERRDDYFAFNGTSMASPHVAAAAALVMSLGVKDPAQVRQILQQAAKPKEPAKHYGAGVLQVDRAVQKVDGAVRDSWLKLLFTVIAGLTGIGVGAVRGHLGALLRYPLAPLGLVLGFLGPDMVLAWLGLTSPFNIILHSALIPLYLLWEADSRAVYRFVAMTAGGYAIHLAWDAFSGHAPFAGVVPAHGLPWLWTNVVVSLGVGLVALRRSFSAG